MSSIFSGSVFNLLFDLRLIQICVKTNLAAGGLKRNQLKVESKKVES